METHFSIFSGWWAHTHMHLVYCSSHWGWDSNCSWPWRTGFSNHLATRPVLKVVILNMLFILSPQLFLSLSPTWKVWSPSYEIAPNPTILSPLFRLKFLLWREDGLMQRTSVWRMNGQRGGRMVGKELGTRGIRGGGVVLWPVSESQPGWDLRTGSTCLYMHIFRALAGYKTS